MNALSQQLDLKIQELQKIEKSVQDRLKRTTANKLLICHSHGCLQFAQREDNTSKRKYVRRNDYRILGPLSNKAYCQKVLPEIQKMLKALLQAQKLLNEAGVLDSPNPAERVWDNWPEELKKLTECKCQSFESRAALWLKANFTAMTPPEDKSHHARSGEYMRSKSEVMIADALFAQHIPYRYEQKLVLPGEYPAQGGQVLYPDFTILNPRTGKVVYLEHLGMLDDADYVERNYSKLMLYQKNGHWLGRDLFITYESHDHPFNTDQIYDIINNCFIVN